MDRIVINKAENGYIVTLVRSGLEVSMNISNTSAGVLDIVAKLLNDIT